MYKFIIFNLIAFHLFFVCGCATTLENKDDKEFSDMPWNTPQQWEGSKQMPGMGGFGGAQRY